MLESQLANLSRTIPRYSRVSGYPTFPHSPARAVGCANVNCDGERDALARAVRRRWQRPQPSGAAQRRGHGGPRARAAMSGAKAAPAQPRRKGESRGVPGGRGRPWTRIYARWVRGAARGQYACRVDHDFLILKMRLSRGGGGSCDCEAADGRRGCLPSRGAPPRLGKRTKCVQTNQTSSVRKNENATFDQVEIRLPSQSAAAAASLCDP